MKRLYVLYDHGCGMCTAAVRWLKGQPRYLEVTAIPAASQRAAERFPTLARRDHQPEQVIVVSDEGDVWRGPAAWIMCLYATRRFRHLAFTLSRPGWLPATTRVIEFLSTYRLGLSRLLRLEAGKIGRGEAAAEVTACPTGACTSTQ